MQDRELVAAVVAGDPDGVAAAYDQFAAPLYAYCHLMLPDPDAADVVRDTFLIATARLGGLSDPDRLGSWLYAVARNECLRRLRAAGITSRPPRVPSDGALAGIELPAGLRGQVIKACTDSTPTGRAQRASAAHRAGSFGPTGFPKAIGSPGPRWWRRVRRHPRAAAVATVAAATAATGVVMLTVGAPHRTQASIVALGGGIPGGSAGAASGGGASAAASHRASPAKGQPKPSVTAPRSLPSPAPSPPTGPGTRPPSVPASRTSSSAAPSSPSPSPSPSPPPTEGILEAVPNHLALTSTLGKAVSGTFLLSALDGPVGHYAIRVPAGMATRVKVAPAQGSLPTGGRVIVTVTVTSKVAINTTIKVYPGAIAVSVRLSVTA